MRRHIRLLIAPSAAAAFMIGCQPAEGPAPASRAASSVASPAHEYHDVLADAACGQCQFDLPGSGCDLAVRIDGASYFVDGTGIDDHGDAHASDGLCNAVRRARVSGRVEHGRFVATHFELRPGNEE